MAERLGNNVLLSHQRAARALLAPVAMWLNKSVEEIKFYCEQCVEGSPRILNLNIRLDISLKSYTCMKKPTMRLKYRDVSS